MSVIVRLRYQSEDSTIFLYIQVSQALNPRQIEAARIIWYNNLFISLVIRCSSLSERYAQASCYETLHATAGFEITAYVFAACLYADSACLTGKERRIVPF